MNRVVIHWTGGAHTANASDKRHYHFIIEGDGTVVAGNHPPEANATINSPRDGSTYAAHTRGLNTGSIGIALAAMRGATERPFNAGPSPITQAQVDALVALTARLCGQYAIPVQRDTVLTHAEVQQTLKIAQRGKWDVRWLPGMTKLGAAVDVGDKLRDMITDALSANKFDAPASGPVAWLLRLFFGGRK
jgi:N-acetyl-anhydromuramyl-L-alanine amidase AmpD